MFEPGDPRYEEILDLANLATRDRLLDGQRGRWRELVTQLLGSVQSEGSAAERRHDLRGPAELEVDKHVRGHLRVGASELDLASVGAAYLRPHDSTRLPIRFA